MTPVVNARHHNMAASHQSNLAGRLHADDVILLNLRGEITEASTSNLGFVRDGELLTPPLEAGILEGITRGVILRQVAAAAGVRVREAVVRPEDLFRMEECLLLSTTKEVLQIGRAHV